MNPDEAKVVRRIFNMYIEGSGGLKAVTAELNREKTLRRGNVWSTTTIHHVLKNPIYSVQQGIPATAGEGDRAEW